MGLASSMLLATAVLPFLAAASPTTAVPGTPVAERGAHPAPVDTPRGLAQGKSEAGVSGSGGSKDAAHRSDFGLRALQRATRSYVAGDSALARRNLAEATDILVNLANSMEAPGRGEVWMLVNDLRLLRLTEGGVHPATLHGLNDAETRASALAERHGDGLSAPAAPRH